MSVVVDVSDERMKISSRDKSLGDWPLDEMRVVSLPDGFHLKFEDEEIVLTVSDPDTFFDLVRSANGSLAPPEPAGTLNPERNRPSDGRTGDTTISDRLKPTDPEEQYSDLRSAVDTLAAAMLDERIPPEQIFSTWLRLLKELNHRHGRGNMPTPLYYRLTTEVLDIMPVPGAGGD